MKLPLVSWWHRWRGTRARLRELTLQQRDRARRETLQRAVGAVSEQWRQQERYRRDGY